MFPDMLNTSLPAGLARRVLIIEDEQDVFTLLDYHFKAHGFETRWASNGADGLAEIREQPPDAVLLDVMLPRLSGFEVCRTIKSEPALRGIPVVMLTARTGDSERLHGHECGADDYLTKPFHPREVVRRIIELLAVRQANPARPGSSVCH